MELKIFQVGKNAYHVRSTDESKSMLSRYGILKGQDVPVADSAYIRIVGDSVVFGVKREVTFSLKEYKDGYSITAQLSNKERLFGLGDSNRERIMIRGMRITLNKENVRCYGPMPILLSSDGWALFVNTTYRSVFDLGNTNSDELCVSILGGQADIYLFKSDTLLGLTTSITEITGRPTLLPKFAYGLTVVNNERINDAQLLEYTRLYREMGIPCDCMGLEPYWMSKYYDFSVDKKWNDEKFYVPYWKPSNTSDRGTFFHNLRRMGMQLSLWLCEDYDVVYNEENAHPYVEDYEISEDAEIADAHFEQPAIYQDKITKIGERWFEHLKKFVDNGAAAFKLDASNQVLAHPDRLWGGRFHDNEVHNVYPVLLAKDMAEGHKEYNGRRLMINTSCAYVGTQQYAATWAGDTGGGPKTLVSVMNYSMCGHSNSGCDIDVTNLQSMHYGFLMPWTQQNNWNSWNYPWYLGEELKEIYKSYSLMRSSLFPYLYYMSFIAHRDGVPMLRPLPLVYSDTDKFDNVKNAYMLGDSLYVGVFDMNLTLPEGEWIDYFTGESIVGGRSIKYMPPERIGGALFVKSGAIIVTMTPQRYLTEREHEYVINLYPSSEQGSTAIYEDDGYTYDYQMGGYALTEIISSGIKNSELTLTIGERQGSFDGRTDNRHDIANNSIPKICSVGALRDIKVVVHGKIPASITLCGQDVSITTIDGKCEFIVKATERVGGALNYVLRF